MTTAKLIDAFLYNDEVELLEIRLQLLRSVVDKFVIVVSRETFTGIKKPELFPDNNPVVLANKDRIELIIIDRLEGKTAWEKESFSRNALENGLGDLSDEDLIMVSDIDELPQPAILKAVKEDHDFDDAAEHFVSAEKIKRQKINRSQSRNSTAEKKSGTVFIILISVFIQTRFNRPRRTQKT
mgnify:CR=1 FL=1